MSAAVTVVALTILLAGDSANTPTTHPFLPDLALDGSGTPAGELEGACGTAVDSRGHVYVANSASSGVDIFDPDRYYLSTIPNSDEPCGLAVDSKGNLYVLESATGEVVKYVPPAYPFRGVPIYSAPTAVDRSGKAKGIAVDPVDDRLYVAKGDRVDVYQSDGTLGANEVQGVRLFNTNGGTFKLSFRGDETGPIPHDATHAEVEAALARLPAIGSGNVSVEEGPNGSKDHYVAFTGALGGIDVEPIIDDPSRLDGSSREPRPLEEITKGFSGHIGDGVLTEAGGVEVYTYDGANGEAILIGPSVPDPGSASVEEGSSDREGRFVAFTGAPGGSEAVAAGVFATHTSIFLYRNPSRYLFVADPAGAAADRVHVFGGSDIRTLSRLATIDGSGTPGESIGFGRAGAALDVDHENGHLYVYDTEHGVIDEFEATGPFVSQIDHSSLEDAEPTDIAVDRSGGVNDGTVYVTTDASEGAEVLAFGPLPIPSRLSEYRLSVAGACGTAVGSHGNVYVSTGTTIEIYDPEGNDLSKIADPDRPCDLAVDSAGNLYASTRGAELDGDGEVVVYEPDTNPPTAMTEYGSPRTILRYEGEPGGIAVNPADDHLFVNVEELSIAEYGSAREGSELIDDEIGAGLLEGVEAFNGGLGVCGENGNVYAAGRGDLGWRIYVLNPEGTELVTAIDGSGSPRGVFGTDLSDIAVDQSNCHVFIAPLERAVEEYEASGAFVGEFGSESSLDGDIAVDNASSSPNRGKVYVALATGLLGFGPLSYEEP